MDVISQSYSQSRLREVVGEWCWFGLSLTGFSASLAWLMLVLVDGLPIG